ncbi:hypothetical protein ONE63_002554 [Megalurothrips usitatus]|uniref:Uncharacterized protein n=1 Tax=Megalurothrips usitatus TaxID=439358 RepID=A0AAV7XCS5_9NEOP|nr:hypothetical protein ONE63_002554 [Megalurothrips usitatus]
MWPRWWPLAAVAVLLVAGHPIPARAQDAALLAVTDPTVGITSETTATEATPAAEEAAVNVTDIPDAAKASEEVVIVMAAAGAASGAEESAGRKAGRKLAEPGKPVLPAAPAPGPLAAGPVVVVAAPAVLAPAMAAVTLPPPSSLPLLDGEMPEEDFMEDMQEIEQASDMEMAERSADAAGVADEQVGRQELEAQSPNLRSHRHNVRLALQQEDVASADLPPNHKKSRRDFGASEQNSLLGKQSRFATVAPPDHNSKEYELMMAKLPVRDYPGYNVTGRDKPLDVVFVFPRVENQTRQKEVEVVLIFPQDNATSPTPPSGDPTPSTPVTITVTAGDVPTTERTATAAVSGAAEKEDGDERLELASEREETRAEAPAPARAATPAPAMAAPAFFIARRDRQDIYKKYANKYANSRLPPVSFFRKDDASAQGKRSRTQLADDVADMDDMDTGASETHHVAVPAVVPWPAMAAGASVVLPQQGPAVVPAMVPVANGAFHMVRHESVPAPTPLYIPTPMQAVHPPPPFPSLPPASMHPMLIVVPSISPPAPTTTPSPAAVGAQASPPLASPAPSTLTSGNEEAQASSVDAVVASSPSSEEGAAPAQPSSAPAAPSRGSVRHRPQLRVHPAVTAATTAAHRRPDLHRRRHPSATAHSQQQGNEGAAPTAAAAATAPSTPDVPSSPEPTADLKRTNPRRRPLRNKPAALTTAEDAADTLATTARPALSSSSRGRGRHQNRPQGSRPQIRPRPGPRGHPSAQGPSGGSPDGPPHPRPDIRPIGALRNRIPGIRLHATTARPPPELEASTNVETTTVEPSSGNSSAALQNATQPLSAEDVATIHKITALQQEQQQRNGTSNSTLGINRQERLSSLQSMLVANLVAIQKELAERHAAMRRHLGSPHLPAEHRANGARALARPPAPSPADALTVTPGPSGSAPKRYRRPPSFRKQPSPSEDKQQAARDNKVSYRTLYKKRAGPASGKPADSTTTTSTTTPTTTSTTTTTTTTTPAPTAMPLPVTTDLPEQQTSTDFAVDLEAVEATTLAAATDVEEAAASTDATVIAFPTSEEAAAVTATTPDSITASSATTTAAPPTPAPPAAAEEQEAAGRERGGSPSAAALVSPSAAAPAEAAATAAVTVEPVDAAPPPPVAPVDFREQISEGGFQPNFQPSPQDPVRRLSRPGLSRLSLLGGVLPEDDPALASGLQSLERRDRSAFRAPAQLEGGFVPVVPASAAPSATPAAGAPQIVGPIPSGYKEVLRGTPVQLDLPRPEGPADFLQPQQPQRQLPFQSFQHQG